MERTIKDINEQLYVIENELNKLDELLETKQEFEKTLREKQDQLARLKSNYKREKRDVDNLNKVSFSNILNSISGKKREILDKETEEMNVSKKAYLEFEEELNQMYITLNNYKEKLSKYDSLKEEYNTVKKQKLDLLNSTDPTFKKTYELTSKKLLNIRTHLHEITQASNGGKKAVQLLETAIDDYRLAITANNREMWITDDTHLKIKKAEDINIANATLSHAQTLITQFVKELKDIEYEFKLNKLSDIKYDLKSDIYFDNLWKDLNLKTSLQNKVAEIKRIKDKISRIISELRIIKTNTLKQEKALEIELNKLMGL